MSDIQDTKDTVRVHEDDAGGATVIFSDERRGRDPDADDDDDGPGSAGGERSRSSLRRSRSRNKRHEREQQIEVLSGAVNSLDHMVKVLARGQQEQAITTLDGELRNAQLAYNEAQRREAEAISKGDGATASEARRVMQNAERHFAAVQAQINQIRSNAVEVPQQEQQGGAPPRNPRADRYKEDFLDRNTWIDLDKDTVTTRIVRTVDATVAADGFAPGSQEYWDELDDRLRKEMPHQFTGNTKMASRRDDDDDADLPPRRGGSPPLGGSGRGARDGDLGPGQFRIDAEQVKALDEVGIPLTGGTPEQVSRRNKIFAQWRENAPVAGRR